jgi:NTF2 fold immunity protein
MKNLNILIVSVCFVILFTSCNNNRTVLGRQFAIEELKSALSDSIGHNVLQKGFIAINDSTTATAIAEAVLFGIYGTDNIKKQKPYEIYHLDNYWLLSGTLPSGLNVGTFLIIMDAKDARIIKMSHGK